VAAADQREDARLLNNLHAVVRSRPTRECASLAATGVGQATRLAQTSRTHAWMINWELALF